MTPAETEATQATSTEWVEVPVPVNEITCGEFAALSVKVMVALNGPADNGEKVIAVTLQDAEAASGEAATQPSVMLKLPLFVPPRTTLEMVIALPPVLVSSNVCGEEEDPTATEPNANEVLSNVATGPDGPPTPWPVSEIMCGLPKPLSVIVIWPVNVPMLVGVNVTVKPQPLYGATGLKQLLVWLKAAPVLTMLVIVNGEETRLAKLTDNVGELLTITDPKLATGGVKRTVVPTGGYCTRTLCLVLPSMLPPDIFAVS